MLSTDGKRESTGELKNTTMDPISVHKALADAVKDGAQTSVFEATSQGVVHSRMRHVAWDRAIFTNLTRDHLDLHGSMERYEAAKAQLFNEDLAASSKSKCFAIFNFDEDAGRRIGLDFKFSFPEISSVSFAQSNIRGVDFVVSDLKADVSGLSFTLKSSTTSISINSPLVGNHNASNLACAALALYQLGYKIEDISRVLETVPCVPGRLERVVSSERNVYVDYAHKPDALEKVLRFLKPLTKGRLICVFGCGGDRDKGKRPITGEISFRLADVTVVTSDNPRTEEPAEIVSQIVAGLPVDPNKIIIEVDRTKAIEIALQMSKGDDIVVIAGKGHEPYQEIHGVKYPYDDRTVALNFLQALT